MNVFIELESQYNEIDKYYSTREFQANIRSWVKKERSYQRRREINDQAYFLFMFSRLEDHIREESAKLIRRKQDSISSWKQRAPWWILPKKPEDKINFKSRLALLTDNNSQDFKLVSNYYEERNSIAHGGKFTKPISMPSVILELKRLQNVLKA